MALFFSNSEGVNINGKCANVPFRHNSVCVVQKWLRFKKFITFSLAYIS